MYMYVKELKINISYELNIWVNIKLTLTNLNGERAATLYKWHRYIYFSMMSGKVVGKILDGDFVQRERYKS